MRPLTPIIGGDIAKHVCSRMKHLTYVLGIMHSIFYSLNCIFREFLKPKVGSNILPMSRVCHNCSFQPLIPSHFSTQAMDMCHGTTGSSMFEI